jgi:hypothetical protein
VSGNDEITYALDFMRCAISCSFNKPRWFNKPLGEMPPRRRGRRDPHPAVARTGAG